MFQPVRITWMANRFVNEHFWTILNDNDGDGDGDDDENERLTFVHHTTYANINFDPIELQKLNP